MNWKQEMGWKSEPTRVIQAQPSWKIRLLSGSYCSHEIGRGEGSQMLPRSCFIVRKTAYYGAGFPSATSNGWQGVQNATRGLKLASDIPCFYKALLTAPAGLGSHCPRGCAVSIHWQEWGKRKHCPRVSLDSPSFQWNLISLALEYLLPFAVGWGSGLFCGEVSFQEVMCHLGSAVLFKPGCSLPLRPQQGF